MSLWIDKSNHSKLNAIWPPIGDFVKLPSDNKNNIKTNNKLGNDSDNNNNNTNDNDIWNKPQEDEFAAYFLSDDEEED